LPGKCKSYAVLSIGIYLKEDASIHQSIIEAETETELILKDKRQIADRCS